MKQLLLLLSLVFFIFMGIKVHGVQKYYCTGWIYTPGQSADNFCKQYYSGTEYEDLSKIFPKNFREQWYNECLTTDYKRIKNEYNSGKCNAVKEVKYTDECGATCTKGIDTVGNQLYSSCSGGNSQCIDKREQKLKQSREIQLKYTHICVDSGVTSKGGLHFSQLQIDPTVTAEQYCEYDKTWGGDKYKQCLSKRNNKMNEYKTLNSQGKCYFVKRKSLEYGGVKCTIEYGEKNGEKVQLGTITNGGMELEIGGKTVISNREQKDQCIKKLEEELFPNKGNSGPKPAYNQQNNSTTKTSTSSSKPQTSTSSRNSSPNTYANYKQYVTSYKSINFDNGSCKIWYAADVSTNKITSFSNFSSKGLNTSQKTLCEKKLREKIQKEFNTPKITDHKNWSSPTKVYKYGICECFCPYYYQYGKVKIESGKCYTSFKSPACGECTTLLKNKFK